MKKDKKPILTMKRDLKQYKEPNTDASSSSIQTPNKKTKYNSSPLNSSVEKKIKNKKGKNFSTEELMKVAELFLKYKSFNIHNQMEELGFPSRPVRSYERKFKEKFKSQFLNKIKEEKDSIEELDQVALLKDNQLVGFGQLIKIPDDTGFKIEGILYPSTNYCILLTEVSKEVEVTFLHNEEKKKLTEFIGEKVPWISKNIRYPVEKDGELFEWFSKFNDYENSLNFDLNSNSSPSDVNNSVNNINEQIKNDTMAKAIKKNANIGSECAQDYVSYGTSQKYFTKVLDTYVDLMNKLNLAFEMINEKSSKKKGIFIKYEEKTKYRNLLNHEELIQVSRGIIGDKEFKLSSKIENIEIDIENEEDFTNLPNNSTIYIELF
jgi:hypothetical protein